MRLSPDDDTDLTSVQTRGRGGLTRRARRTRVRYYRPARGKRADASRTTLQRGTPLANRTLVVAVDTDNPDRPLEPELVELEALAQAAGAQIVERVVQRRDHVDPATLVGTGKAREIADLPKNTKRISSSCSTICARVSERTSKK